MYLAKSKYVNDLLKTTAADTINIKELEFKGHLENEVSKENELAAWNLILNQANDCLDMFPTTIEEDEKILA